MIIITLLFLLYEILKGFNSIDPIFGRLTTVENHCFCPELQSSFLIKLIYFSQFPIRLIASEMKIPSSHRNTICIHHLRIFHLVVQLGFSIRGVIYRTKHRRSQGIQHIVYILKKENYPSTKCNFLAKECKITATDKGGSTTTTILERIGYSLLILHVCD